MSLVKPDGYTGTMTHRLAELCGIGPMKVLIPSPHGTPNGAWHALSPNQEPHIQISTPDRHPKHLKSYFAPLTRHAVQGIIGQVFHIEPSMKHD